SSYTVLLVALLGTADVILINVINQPIPSAIELAAAGHVVIIFLALAAIQNRHSHVRVDIFLGFMNPKLRVLAEGFTLLVGMTVFFVLGWESSRMTLHSVAIREIASSQIQFPIYPVKIALTLGCAIAALEFGRQLVWLFLGARPWLDNNTEDGQA
ncbi:MAG: TRAP transporter small permease, partial [Pseudomonadota bacterium]|nr:TRAP transporter small permease [Pseudomonadota bacterium]